MKKWWMMFMLVCVSMLYGSIVYAEGEKEPKPVKNQLIIVNKETNKLAFYEDGELIKIYPVATGRTAALTPEGAFKIVVRVRNMPYYKHHIPGGAPNNPLGPRWMGLNVPGTEGYTYGIHGNAAPWSIGTNASSGCVRMYNEDVTELYGLVETGTTVIITRSSSTFDEIAAQNGYLTVEAKATNNQHIISFEVNQPVYQRASKMKGPVATLTPRTLFAKKEYKNWYYVEEGTIHGWIKDESVMSINTMRDLLAYHWNHFEKKKVYVQEFQQEMMKWKKFFA